MVRVSHERVPFCLLITHPREYRRNVSAHLRKGTTSDRAEKVLALLIESGFVYCLLWVTAHLSSGHQSRLLITIFTPDIFLVDRIQCPPWLWHVYGQLGHAFSIGTSSTTAVQR